VRWWATAELRAADPSRFDPHLLRFVGKVEQLSRLAGGGQPEIGKKIAESSG
jgi:hypothetical protein